MQRRTLPKCIKKKERYGLTFMASLDLKLLPESILNFFLQIKNMAGG